MVDRNRTQELGRDDPHGWKTNQAINSAIRGKLNVVGDFTARSLQTTTTVSDVRIGTGMFVGWEPTSPEGAVLKRSTGGMWFNPQNGYVIFTHDSLTSSAATFCYIVLGAG